MELNQSQINSHRFFFALKKYCEENQKQLKIFKKDLSQYEIQILPDNVIFHFYQTIEGDEELSYPGIGLYQNELSEEKIINIISSSLKLTKQQFLDAIKSGQLPKGILGGMTSISFIST